MKITFFFCKVKLSKRYSLLFCGSASRSPSSLILRCGTSPMLLEVLSQSRRVLADISQGLLQPRTVSTLSYSCTYRSSFPNSGCSPKTFKVLPFSLIPYWGLVSGLFCTLLRGRLFSLKAGFSFRSNRSLFLCPFLLNGLFL